MKRGVPWPEGYRSPRLEPGLDGGPDSERLVAGPAAEPGRAQPEVTTRQLLFLSPVGPPPAGPTIGGGCSATRVAVKADGAS